MLSPTSPPPNRERGLVVMTGLALVTSLLLGGTAVSGWVIPGGTAWKAVDEQSRANAARQPVGLDVSPPASLSACGASAEVQGPVGPPVVHWHFQTDDAIYAAPVLLDDTLFVVNGAGNLYAVNAATGAERWRYSLGSPAGKAPAVGGGVVYASASSGAVSAVESASGRLLWQTPSAGAPASAPVLAGDSLFLVTGEDVAPPTVAGDTVYVGGNGGLVVQSLDALTGRERWRASLAKNGLFALDVATGAERWHLDTRSRVNVAPVIEGDHVYVVDEALHQVDVATGAERWQVPVSTAAKTAADQTQAAHRHVPVAADAMVKALAAQDGMIYLAVDFALRPADGLDALAGWIYAFDDVAGAQRWRFPTGGFSSSAPVIAGDTVYIGGFSGRLLARDWTTGGERWRLELGGHLATPLIACGILYVGDYDGALVAVANA